MHILSKMITLKATGQQSGYFKTRIFKTCSLGAKKWSLPVLKEQVYGCVWWCSGVPNSPCHQPMRLLAWNCQGAGAQLTTRRLEEMCRLYSPGFLFLSETKNDFMHLQNMQVSLGFDSLKTVEPIGNIGGLALFYSKDYPVKFVFVNDRLIDIETIIDGNRVFISFVYGDPVVQYRELVWERLTRIGLSRSDPWFMIGDFNEITGNHEKRGGKSRSESSFLPFRCMIEICGMIEVPSQGNLFSWVGRRSCGVTGRRVRRLIKARLDRALAPHDFDSVLRDVPVMISEDMNQKLSKEISTEEVRRALFSLNPDKTPGPDGMTAFFYQKFWDLTGPDLVKVVQEFHSSGSFDRRLNETNICLIPKTDRPRKMAEFRPISLCNVSYKVISKVLSSRLKKLLPDLISETQSAFVSGRLITDNILIAQENFHALRTNPACKKKFMAIKTDMSKAYDRVEWSFLQALMLKMGFAQKWVDLISYCVSSVSYKILLNGVPRGSIRPTRGIRQGDPLSPFLFILYTEALVANLKEAEWHGRIQGLQVSRASPSTSHLLFADDSLFFCKADPLQGAEIIKILRIYGEASGQQLNTAKSSVMFGHEVDNITRTTIKDAIGGKEVLIKSIAQALPTYVMSCFLLPKAIRSKLSSAIANFWWKTNENSNGIHWIAWEKLCMPYSDGGLGFRTLEEFNLALLAKQLWRLLRHPNSLLSRVLRGRYFRFSDPLHIGNSNRPSYGWRSIMAAKPLLISGLRRTIGSGMLTRVWEDPWIPTIPARPAKSIVNSRDPHLYVNDLIDPTTKMWKLDRIQSLIDPADIPLILGIRPSRTYLSDGYSWSHTKSGNYTVKSGYWAARDLSRPTCDLPFQGPGVTALQAQVWKLKTTRKLMHFAWQCISGCLATSQKLAYRHIGTDKGCSRCGGDEESINHLLFECPPARQIWALSPIPSSGHIFPRNSLFYNFDFLFWRGRDFGIEADVLELFPWILWLCQMWRTSGNNQSYTLSVPPGTADLGAFPDPLEVLRLAEKEAQLWQSAQSELHNGNHGHVELVTQSRVGDASLDSNYSGYHCFVDGSWKESDKFSGTGWFCTSSNGEPPTMGAANLRRSLSPLHTEVEALLWAMKCMIGAYNQEVAFFTDCSDLVKMVSSPTEWPAFSVYLEEFQSDKEEFSTFSLSLISRSANVKADNLARKVRTEPLHITYVNNIPQEWLF
ncbi:Endonuclease/exonuclease/phosphatase superfamily [Arabidopsis thaliana x Arabidopsis arenosa]|uniref:Endonuclease/exonuclease/phosphatase superfamily n=1 Tax=Arabidopsis thaliana x Arabidopsis arenosa TaxID=1240361 RepID=A0A8T1XD72_9BRAS|nr:Endonuclease/exonuclease/phosphatase superfamily [Arabidopsis thaliana x Arabidopsis arenosa]